jgi:putative oxidoreductase
MCSRRPTTRVKTLFALTEDDMSTSTTTARRTRHIALVVSQVLLAVLIGAGGVQKVIASPAMVDLFADVGAGQWLRVVVGTLEVAGAVVC